MRIGVRKAEGRAGRRGTGREGGRGAQMGEPRKIGEKK